MARFVSLGITSLDPAYTGISPVKAIKIALDKAGCTLKDVELIKLNEAVAAQ